MDFTVSEAQDELAGLARKILAEQDSPWADLAAAGVLAAGLPEALGGAGLGLLEQCSVLIEVGRAASDVPYLSSAVLGAGAVAAFGTAAQQERWARPAGRGSVVLTAALAEEVGDDPRVPAARAARTDGRWVLSGVKTTVPYAPGADLFLVPVSSADGVLVFLVEPSDAGVSVQPQVLTSVAPGGAGWCWTAWCWAMTGCSGLRVRRSPTGSWRGPRSDCARCRPGWRSGRWS